MEEPMGRVMFWGLVIALAITACGGGGPSGSGSSPPGGGAGGTQTPERLVTVEVVGYADTVDISSAVVSVSQSGYEWGAAARKSYSEWQSEPARFDVNSPSFRGLTAKIEMPGMFSYPSAWVEKKDLDLSADTVVIKVPLARDLNGKGWNCTTTGFVDGKVDVTKSGGGSVELTRGGVDYLQAGASVPASVLNGNIVGDRIFGQSVESGITSTISGSAGPNSFAATKTYTANNKLVQYKYDCTR
jgi:hypothetical protein